MHRESLDVTQGAIWKQLMALFIPLWFGTFFQQLYNTVDTVVVGRFVGKTALAAVGSTGTVVTLAVGIFTGLASGTVVIIAQYYGARLYRDVYRGVHTAMAFSLILGAVFMAACFFAAEPALRAMHTTADALPGAVHYLKICALGMIPNVVYNVGTGVLRAIGDSRRPLYFLIAASMCNIVLDLVLVLGLQLGVTGVAVATVLSQLLSAVLVVISLMRASGQPYQLFPKEMRLDGQIMRSTMKIGAPAALQSVMYNISNIVIQATINSFGTDTVAAWTAYGKMDLLFWMSISTMGLTITTFAGQNYGAGRIDRLKQGVRVSVAMSAVFTLALSLSMVLLAWPLTGIFTPDADVQAIGAKMVRFLAPTYVTYILVEILFGAIRGAGVALVPMFISVFGVCGLRMLWLFTAVPYYHTVEMVELSYPITWTVTSIAALIYYCRGRWLRVAGEARLERQG